jgi:putative Ca2+/H+ antiporter (TMEM165/GDT1 family)
VSLAVAGTVFGIIALAELPDKTMIATLVMGSRRRPVLVWAGGCGAFLVHVAVAVAAGRAVQLLPHRALEVVTTALFFGGALYLLLVPERAAEAKGEAEGERGVAALAAGDRPPREHAVAALTSPSPWRVVGTSFGVLLVGELGDLTELLVLNLAARYRSPVSVFVGAYAALVVVCALGAWGGRALLRWLPLSVIRRVGGVVLVGFTAYGVYSLVR